MDILISLTVQILWIVVAASVVTLAYVTIGILLGHNEDNDKQD